MTPRSPYFDLVRRHYEKFWRDESRVYRWPKGPVHELPEQFGMLEFRPRPGRRMWTYATCGMSAVDDKRPLELHLFSLSQSMDLVELLTIVTHFHRTGESLWLGHTVNFGRPWLKGSLCTFGLISLPYLDGPDLQNARIMDQENETQFLWLIPVTPGEVAYKQKYGLDALETLFEKTGFDYIDPMRRDSVG